MSGLEETPVWEPEIYQWETDDPVEGGPGGIDNVPTKQLANRTSYLKQEVESTQAGQAAHAADADPHPQYAPKLNPVLTAPTVAAAPGAGDNSLKLVPSAWVVTAIATAIADLVASSPAALDTLNEIAAALGNDANFATTITNALALKAPLASPAFTGNPTAPTAAQFDNDTSLTNSAFVQRALGNMRGQFPFNASQALSDAQAGGLVAFYGATAGQTLTLPIASSVAGGAGYWILNAASVAVSVAPSGADTITRNLVVGGSSTAAPLVLNPGDCIFFGSAGAGSWGTFGITQAALLASDKGTTAPQFDVSGKLTTMQALQRALGNFQGAITNGAASVALTALDAGKSIYLIGGGAQTVTLPALASVVPGASFLIAKANAAGTITASGAELIDTRAATSNSITINSGEEVLIVALAGNWICMGGSLSYRALGVAGGGPFGASIGTSGWFKLPSGIIVQYGIWTASGTAGNPVAVTFPMAFPNARRALKVAPLNASASITSAWFDTPSTTGFNGRANIAGIGCEYIAIGN